MTGGGQVEGCREDRRTGETGGQVGREAGGLGQDDGTDQTGVGEHT